MNFNSLHSQMNYDLLPADEAALQKAGSIANTTFKGIKQTFLLTQYVITNNIEGALVECGVAAGAQLGAIGYAVQKHSAKWGVERPIHVFDSFQGIPFAGPKDDQQPGIGYQFIIDPNLPISERLKSSGVSSSTLADVKKNITWFGLDNLRWIFHEGWFQDTTQKANLAKIALLRLDGDLYESTLCCLENLYHKVVKDGVVIIDDYGLKGCERAVHDYFGNNLPELINESDYNARYFFVP